MNRSYYEKIRKLFAIVLIVSVTFIYSLQLFHLQILSSSYATLADNNAFLKRIRYPSRGMIFDRNGNLLVQNQKIHNLMVDTKKIKKSEILSLGEILNLTTKELNQRLEKVKQIQKHSGDLSCIAQSVFCQLNDRKYRLFQEFAYKFRGFYIQNREIRKYTYPYAAHVLGYLGKVSHQNILDDSYYDGEDYIGKTGVECYYENQLRGEKGFEILLRDACGRIQGSYENGKYDTFPISGKSLTLSIDMNLQAYGEYLMQNKLGSIIMIQPNSGEILCMLSSPTYDPSVLLGENFGKSFFQLLINPYKPLLNRAVGGSYPPGSTFKMAQGVVFLQEKILKSNTKFVCNGGWIKGKGHPACHHHHSPLDLVLAIETSCNSYFCSGLKAMLENKKYASIKQSINIWRKYILSQGLGHSLGVDLPGEKNGMIPNSQYYDKVYKKKWNAFSVISIAIGQGEVSFTPLQLCNLAVTIANKGYFYTPHIVKKISNNTMLNCKYLSPRYTKIQSKNYFPIIEGMRLSVTNGTCHVANIPNIDICGKTGTAQNKGLDHSLFIGFAPMKHPRVAILVLIENGGFGASCAALIGKLMIQKYLNEPISDKDKLIEEKVKNTIVL